MSKSSVRLLESVGAWQIIEDIGGCNAVKEMRVSVFYEHNKSFLRSTFGPPTGIICQPILLPNTEILFSIHLTKKLDLTT